MTIGTSQAYVKSKLDAALKSKDSVRRFRDGIKICIKTCSRKITHEKF